MAFPRIQESTPGWTETELDEAALALCEEMPGTRMIACWRAIEHCRLTPRGTPDSLRAHMRETLRQDITAMHPTVLAA